MNDEDNIITCRCCGEEITPERESTFHEEDIENNVQPLCMDCDMEMDSISRDFGF